MTIRHRLLIGCRYHNRDETLAVRVSHGRLGNAGVIDGDARLVRTTRQ
jgi:hypothetical protein